MVASERPGPPRSLPSCAPSSKRCSSTRYDTEHGGWGFAKKYLDWDSRRVLDAASPGRATAAAERARETLAGERRLVDPVWGGIYQYSDSGDWDHPHFEKIMAFQAETMRVYLVGLRAVARPGGPPGRARRPPLPAGVPEHPGGGVLRQPGRRPRGRRARGRVLRPGRRRAPAPRGPPRRHPPLHPRDRLGGDGARGIARRHRRRGAAGRSGHRGAMDPGPSCSPRRRLSPRHGSPRAVVFDGRRRAVPGRLGGGGPCVSRSGPPRATESG